MFRDMLLSTVRPYHHLVATTTMM